MEFRDSDATMLQGHETRLQLLEKASLQTGEDMGELKKKLDGLDTIIRGGVASPGLVELIGKANTMIVEVQRGQASVAQQREVDDRTNKALLNQILAAQQVNAESIAKVAQAEATTEGKIHGSFSTAEKLLGLCILLGTLLVEIFKH